MRNVDDKNTQALEGRGQDYLVPLAQIMWKEVAYVRSLKFGADSHSVPWRKKRARRWLM